MPEMTKKNGDGTMERATFAYGPGPQHGQDLRDCQDSGVLLTGNKGSKDHSGRVTSDPARPESPSRHHRLDTLG